MSSTWTFEEFKESILPEIGSPPISDVNIKVCVLFNMILGWVSFVLTRFRSTCNSCFFMHLLHLLYASSIIFLVVLL